MIDRLEIYSAFRATIPLSFLEISDLYIVPTKFYASLNAKNRMCELCTFSIMYEYFVHYAAHVMPTKYH